MFTFAQINIHLIYPLIMFECFPNLVRGQILSYVSGFMLLYYSAVLTNSAWIHLLREAVSLLSWAHMEDF